MARISSGKRPPRSKKTQRKDHEPMQISPKFYEGIGRRKTAVARVRLIPGGTGSFVVNAKPLEQYFQNPEQQITAREALLKTPEAQTLDVLVKAEGSGMNAQAEAVRQGTARALIGLNGTLRPALKVSGFLTRDPRMRERKKFGLKRARRARQWRKR